MVIKIFTKLIKETSMGLFPVAVVRVKSNVNYEGFGMPIRSMG